MTRWGNDPQVYVFERQGYPGLLVGLNNDQWNSSDAHGANNFGPSVQLHEYTGKHGDMWTDGRGRATFTVPRNDNGQSYLCFSRVGYAQAFALQERTTTQTYFGAIDLDLSPAVNTARVRAARVWCRRGSEVQAELNADTKGWENGMQIDVDLSDTKGKVLASQPLTAKTAARLRTNADQSGWLALHVAGRGLAAAGAAYELKVTYTGTQELAS